MTSKIKSNRVIVKTPLARCSKCGHKLYHEDRDWESTSFVDSSGNNDRSYHHIQCPKHRMKVTKTTIEKTCLDCGVTHEESFQ